MTDILIVGNGWLGNILKDYLHADITTKRISELEPRDIYPYQTIINCAANTNIDWCEKNKSASLSNNALAAEHLAKLCNSLQKKYVFISSSCIFESKDKNDWKHEESAPNPGCWYAFTKVIAEGLVQEACPDTLIVRIRVPFSERKHPRNTLDKLASYARLQTNQESITIVEDMLPVLADLINKKEKGVFHLINEDTISPEEVGFMLGTKFMPISKEDLDAMMVKEGRARRVSTLVTSRKIMHLPSVHKRMPDLIAKWKKS